jgi:hypothetical protein
MDVIRDCFRLHRGSHVRSERSRLDLRAKALANGWPLAAF